MAEPSTKVRRKNFRGKTPSGQPNPIDVHVGNRVRLRRTLLGLSQGMLGEALGLTFQQVQKYERGANRVGASRMFDISRVLDVPVSFFFDDMPDEIKAQAPSFLGAGQPETTFPAADKDPLQRRETLELVRAYYSIDDPDVRKRIYDLTKALASAAAGGQSGT